VALLGDDVAIQVTKGSITALGQHQVGKIVEDPDVLVPPCVYRVVKGVQVTLIATPLDAL
jgi:hypothetical protein